MFKRGDMVRVNGNKSTYLTLFVKEGMFGTVLEYDKRDDTYYVRINYNLQWIESQCLERV